MLKITRTGPSDLLIEGKLVGPYVEALREACDATREPPTRLNLAAVTFVDADGLDLLETLRDTGAVLVSCSAFVQQLLQVRTQ